MATAMPTYEDRRVSIGRIFQRAGNAIATRPGVIVGLAVVFGAVPSLALRHIASVLVIGGAGGAATPIPIMLEFMFVSMPIVMAVSSFVQAAITRATVSVSAGTTATFGECVETAVMVFLPLVAMALLSTIGVALGFVLLVVPGVILLLTWSVALPTLVIERVGIFEAFRRSADLTKGAKWQISGIFLLLGMGYWALVLVLRTFGLTMYNPPESSGLTVANVIGSILQTATLTVAGGTVWPSLYLELRRWKEGESIHNLAEVFA